MLSDTEIFQLQRSIAVHRSRQQQEILTRDNAIADLRKDNSNLNSVILKHQEQYAQLKEQLVKVMLEFEMRGILLDAEQAKNVKASALLDQKDNAIEIARQDKEFLRRQLTEAEGLLSQNSQQRSKAQDLETSLLHAREQIRLLTDNQSSLNSQLQSSIRDLEESKFKVASGELRTELVMKEKTFLVEEAFDLRQQIAKYRASSIDELSELKRELLKSKDLTEQERVMRIKVESNSDTNRAKEMEEYRSRLDAQHRELEARSPVPNLEREKDKLSSQIDALRVALDAKEMERSLENKKSRELEAQIAQLQLQLDTVGHTVEEAKVRYEAVRAEGRYARQKVLQFQFKPANRHQQALHTTTCTS